MEFKKTCVTFLSAFMITTSIWAEDVTVIGSIEHTLIQGSADPLLRENENHDKVIQLMHVELSDEAKNSLLKRAKEASTHTHAFSKKINPTHSLLPGKIQIGMNNVPVLDQGRHGSCVTFAVTGVIDAAMGKGDYISQLCNLQLGNYLETHGHGVSGWNGTDTLQVISQIQQYGVVNLSHQRTKGCGDLTEYPLSSWYPPVSNIEPEKYSKISEFVFGKVVNWSDIYTKNDPVKTLNDVKRSLNEGDRLEFSVLLPRTDLGTTGAIGKHKTPIYPDTWVLSSDIIQGAKNVKSAHAMIITGYDDSAVAKDNDGNKYKGLLTLRNSWGSTSGNHGEFYMTYDYFKLLSYDVKRFSPERVIN